MRKHYFIKEGAPVWIHVPGTPFTLPGERQQYSRLPGMTEWAPNEVIERIGKGLQDDVSARELVEQEKNRGLLGQGVKGGIGGLTLGAVGTRLMGGEAVANPFKEIASKGLSSKTWQGVKNIPKKFKAGPAIGAGLGVLGGLGMWAAGRDARQEEAGEVTKGLLAENILQHHSLGEARDYANKTLQGLPAETASMPAPIAVVPGNTGV